MGFTGYCEVRTTVFKVTSGEVESMISTKLRLRQKLIGTDRHLCTLYTSYSIDMLYKFRRFHPRFNEKSLNISGCVIFKVIIMKMTMVFPRNIVLKILSEKEDIS